jgi:hypothetical protein
VAKMLDFVVQRHEEIATPKTLLRLPLAKKAGHMIILISKTVRLHHFRKHGLTRTPEDADIELHPTKIHRLHCISLTTGLCLFVQRTW